MWWNGRNTLDTDPVGASRGMSADCSAERTDRIPWPDTLDSATARRSMEHTTARAPYTTKCSPNNMALPGASYTKDSGTPLHPVPAKQDAPPHGRMVIECRV